MADLMRYYPAWVCAKCGTQYGRKAAGLATWHPGTCGVCLADAAVTEPRDFGHLRDDWKERYSKACGGSDLTAELGEFEVWQNDEMVASMSGPRDLALREAFVYAALYVNDGPVEVYEVTRKLILVPNVDVTGAEPASSAERPR